MVRLVARSVFLLLTNFHEFFLFGCWLHVWSALPFYVQSWVELVHMRTGDALSGNVFTIDMPSRAFINGIISGVVVYFGVLVLLISIWTRSLEDPPHICVTGVSVWRDVAQSFFFSLHMARPTL